MRSLRAQTDPSVRTRLTPRQREVLALIAAGATNAEIAQRLGLSLEGAKWHVREIFNRLGVDSREEAAAVWKQDRRFAPFGLAPFALVGGAVVVVTVAAVAAVVVLFAVAGSDGAANTGPTAGDVTASSLASTPLGSWPPYPRPTPVPVSAKPQPPLREVASGESWRMLAADDGLGLPVRERWLLAVAYDQAVPYVNVLDATDGRVFARIETGYTPMARLNPVTGELLVSDWAGRAPDGSLSARLLVFNLKAQSLVTEVVLAQKRVNFTVPDSAIYVSSDGRWFYWIEHGTVCPSGGNSEVCDQHIFRAVDLASGTATDYAAPMPIGCGIPRVWQSGPSGLEAQCLPRPGSTAWRIDATSAVRDAAVSLSVAGVGMSWLSQRSGGTILDVSHESDGALTGLVLRDASTGQRRGEWPLSEAWSVFLLDERTLLLLRPTGRLEKFDLLMGTGEQLPYAIDPGRQGLDILFWR